MTQNEGWLVVALGVSLLANVALLFVFLWQRCDDADRMRR
jgi:hypothetical protein